MPLEEGLAATNRYFIGPCRGTRRARPSVSRPAVAPPFAAAIDPCHRRQFKRNRGRYHGNHHPRCGLVGASSVRHAFAIWGTTLPVSRFRTKPDCRRLLPENPDLRTRLARFWHARFERAICASDTIRARRLQGRKRRSSVSAHPRAGGREARSQARRHGGPRHRPLLRRRRSSS